MSKVALLDTNLSSEPLYQYLVAAGHEVFVVGGNDQDYLARSAPNHVKLDYSDVAATLAMVDDLKVDFIVPGCNDRSYLTCAEIAAVRDFPGIDSVSATDTINNKQAFRQFAQTHNLPIPSVWQRDDLPTDRALIVKPVDAYSGRGITVLDALTEQPLQEAIARAQQFSKSGHYLIEDFVSGQLYSHTAFIAGGKIQIDHIVEEHGSANPFTVDTSCVTLGLPPQILSAVRQDITVMAEALGLVDGLVHTQFIAQKERYWIIEVTRRCPGDLYSLLIQFSTGTAYAENYVRPFLGMPFDLTPLSGSQRSILRHTISQPAEQTFGSLSFHQALMIERYYPLSRAGDRVPGAPFGRIGLLFVDAGTPEQLGALMACTVRRDLYSIRSL